MMSNASIPSTVPRSRKIYRFIRNAVVLLVLAASGGLTFHFWGRYTISSEMLVPIREFSTAEYPEDPADRSVHDHHYQGRQLRLIQRDETHFDFVFEPLEKHVAQIAFRNVDVSLMTPSVPAWVKNDRDLTVIALTDRQWNRQQVRFDVKSPMVEITEGDGFEKEKLFSAELAKNCLNAGLWEILLFTQENDSKTLYYQGWFTFPLGHYQRLFEKNSGLSYRDHWFKLEHWKDPAGTPVKMDLLRKVEREREAAVSSDPKERMMAAGEQRRKLRTLNANGLVDWACLFDGRPISFASFIPPGRYEHDKPHNNEFWRLANFEKGIVRDIISPAGDATLQEIELVFKDNRQGQRCHFFVSGVDLNALPQLPLEKYADGLYMPMGIGVPPFFQKYEALLQQHPANSPFVSVLLDEQGRWLNHHEIAVDGPVLHRDATDPDTVHLYLLSYERHTLVGHFVIKLATKEAAGTKSEGALEAKPTG